MNRLPRFVAAALSAALGFASGPATAEKPIQPGAQVVIGANACTLNFVFAAASTTYIGTAGHCGKVGDRATASGAEFGTIRFSRKDDALDFALIEVDAAKTGQVQAAVRDWGKTSGVTDEAETALGDEVWIHGYGTGFGSVPQLRSRSGLLFEDTDTWYTADMPAVNGDSGGPVIHARTGKALGIVSAYGYSYGKPTTDRGPTVEHIIRSVRNAGIPISLVTG